MTLIRAVADAVEDRHPPHAAVVRALGLRQRARLTDLSATGTGTG